MAVSFTSRPASTGPPTFLVVARAMDLQALAAVIKGAETCLAEHGDYAGATVGQVWVDWPEEVLTGRLSQACKGRNANNEIIKGYTKFAKRRLSCMDWSER